MDSQELQKVKNKFDIVGNDAGLNRAIETAVAVAPTDLTVLISGESGVGKETIPQIIHQYSRRRTGKYLAVNCGAIPEARAGHAATPCRFGGVDFAFLPQGVHPGESGGQGAGLSAEAYAAAFGRGYAFCLTSPYVFPFILRHE